MVSPLVLPMSFTNFKDWSETINGYEHGWLSVTKLLGIFTLIPKEDKDKKLFKELAAIEMIKHNLKL